MKLSIIAGTITGNRGAEAMLTTVIGLFRERYKNPEIHVFSYYPKEDRLLVRQPNLTIHSSMPRSLVFQLMPGALLFWVCTKLHALKLMKGLVPASVQALAESRVLIDLAGVSFIDSRLKFLPFNMLSLLPAMLCGTPVVKFSQAIGPVHHPLNRFACRMVLRHVHRIYARGDETEAFLQDAPVRADCLARAADVAFLHQPAFSLTQENSNRVEQSREQLLAVRSRVKVVIGICPSAVVAAKARKQNWNYIALLFRMVEHLVKQGCGVFLFPNATRQSQIPLLRNNDLSVIEDVVRYARTCKLDCENLIFVNYDINTVGIKSLLQECDGVVVSRFHAMIAALSLAKPLLVMGWGHKYREVMRLFQMEDQVFNYRRYALPDILERLDQLIASREELAEQINRCLPVVRESSRTQFNETFQWLEMDEDQR